MMTIFGHNIKTTLKSFFESKAYHFLLISLLVISLFTIGAELSFTGTLNGGDVFIYWFNRLVVIIFALEILAKISVYGFTFFKSPWHLFDVLIVGISLLAFGSSFQVMRTFRLFSLVRFISFFPHFRHIIEAVGKAIPHMLSTAMLLFIAIYIFALTGMSYFGKAHPDLYGSIGTSLITLGKCVLMPHTWSEHLEELDKTFPGAWMLVLPMIIVLNFLLLQMVIGIIVGALMRQQAEDEKSIKHKFLDRWLKNQHTLEETEKHISVETKILLHEIENLRKEIKEIKNVPVEKA